MNFFSGRKTQTNKPIKIGDFKPGDPDPTTGKTIIYIAYQTKKFVICIDSRTNLNWYSDENLKTAADFGQITSQVTLAESLIDRIFASKKNRLAYKKLLADVLSSLFEECSSATSILTLAEAKARILEHSRERVRMAYINYAFTSVMVVGLCVIFTLVYRDWLTGLINNITIFRIMICTFLGGIGAFITTFSTFQNYRGSIVSGLPIHRLDGFLRIFYGLIAGLIIALAIKGNVLAGFAGDEKPWLLYFFAIVAGASEILIPNLIHQAENQIIVKPLSSPLDAPPPPPDKPAPSQDGPLSPPEPPSSPPEPPVAPSSPPVPPSSPPEPHFPIYEP